MLTDGGLLIMSSHNRGARILGVGPGRQLLGPPARSAGCAASPAGSCASRGDSPTTAVCAASSASGPDYAIVNDSAHHYSILHYYISRDDQERQLAEHGFELIECLDLDAPAGRRRRARAELVRAALRRPARLSADQGDSVPPLPSVTVPRSVVVVVGTVVVLDSSVVVVVVGGAVVVLVVLVAVLVVVVELEVVVGVVVEGVVVLALEVVESSSPALTTARAAPSPIDHRDEHGDHRLHAGAHALARRLVPVAPAGASRRRDVHAARGVLVHGAGA